MENEPEHIHGHAQSRDTHEPITAHQGAHVSAPRINIKVDANALSIVALILAVAAFVIVLVQGYYAPQIVDSKITAAVAQAQASMANQVAEAQATAQAGKEHARIALDEVQRSNAQLEAKGLLKHATH